MGFASDVQVTLRVELAGLDLGTVTTHYRLCVRTAGSGFCQFTLDTVDTVDRVDEENENEDKGDLWTDNQFTATCGALTSTDKRTFIPYWSLAITGLWEMNSKVFLRQVNGRGNTRRRNIDISSIRIANTYSEADR